jgi:hypothetical protein
VGRNCNARDSSLRRHAQGLRKVTAVGLLHREDAAARPRRYSGRA